ncbi:MAG: hypothetical protein JWQ27_2681 [Ferruginibacter sp.]|nr:hypothetical protein [Ferruginibacter sp.]
MKQLRQITGLTQEELAMFLKVTRSSLNQFELGKRPLDSSTSILLAGLLQDLLNMEKAPNAQPLPADIQAVVQAAEQEAADKMILQKITWMQALKTAEKNLAAMQARAKRLKNWLILIDRKLTNPAPGPVGDWQSNCFETFKTKALEELLNCHEPVQVETAIKIAAIKASLRELKRIKRVANLAMRMAKSGLAQNRANAATP